MEEHLRASKECMHEYSNMCVLKVHENETMFIDEENGCEEPPHGWQSAYIGPKASMIIIFCPYCGQMTNSIEGHFQNSIECNIKRIHEE